MSIEEIVRQAEIDSQSLATLCKYSRRTFLYFESRMLKTKGMRKEDRIALCRVAAAATCVYNQRGGYSLDLRHGWFPMIMEKLLKLEEEDFFYYYESLISFGYFHGWVY